MNKPTQISDSSCGNEEIHYMRRYVETLEEQIDELKAQVALLIEAQTLLFSIINKTRGSSFSSGS